MSAAATWFLRTVSTRVQRRFRDKVDDRARIARRAAAGVGRDDRASERPEYLDRLAMLRNQVFVLDHMYMSLFSTLRVDSAAGRDDGAAGVDPSGARCCWRCSRIPTVLTSTWRPAVERAAQERGAQASRLARHLFTSRQPRRRAKKCASPASASV